MTKIYTLDIAILFRYICNTLLFSVCLLFAFTSFGKTQNIYTVEHYKNVKEIKANSNVLKKYLAARFASYENAKVADVITEASNLEFTNLFHLVTFALAQEDAETIKFLKEGWIKHKIFSAKKWPDYRLLGAPLELIMYPPLNEPRNKYVERYVDYISIFPEDVFNFIDAKFIISDCSKLLDFGLRQQAIQCYNSKINASPVQKKYSKDSYKFAYLDLSYLLYEDGNKENLLNLSKTDFAANYNQGFVKQYLYILVELLNKNPKNLLQRISYLYKKINQNPDLTSLLPILFSLELEAILLLKGPQQAISYYNLKSKWEMTTTNKNKIILNLKMLDLISNQANFNNSLDTITEQLLNFIQTPQIRSLEAAAYYCLSRKVLKSNNVKICNNYLSLINRTFDSSIKMHPRLLISQLILKNTAKLEKIDSKLWLSELQTLISAAGINSGFLYAAAKQLKNRP
jgi:hypothetical protein